MDFSQISQQATEKPLQLPLPKKQKVAVVGSGISGLSAAWFLSQHHDVTLFEKEDRLGGHTNTIAVDNGSDKLAIDTGFIVFNEPNYPLLSAMFKHLDVSTQDTSMSFSVSMNQGGLEYSGSGINGLFCQRRNLLNPLHWSMITEILRFNRQAKLDLPVVEHLNVSMQDYLLQHQFSARMQSHYLLPMAAAIWSCPLDEMLRFPAGSFLRFFENHGLLNIQDRPRWESVVGGSKTYIDKMLEVANFKVRLQAEIQHIKALDSALLEVGFDNGTSQQFDHVVMASHADQSYKMLQGELKKQFSFLQFFKYQKNIAYLHTDESLMPKRKAAWSAWNYLSETKLKADQHEQQFDSQAVSVTYWMNLLQNLQSDKPLPNYLVSLNPLKQPAEDKTLKKIIYHHPVFDLKAMNTQSRIATMQGKSNIWLCGSYCGYGFHEDGIASSASLAKLWGIPLPWQKTQTETNE